MDISFEFIKNLPAKRRQSPSGWITFNCPACSHLGHRPDKRGRGGFKLLAGGGFVVHCFNCTFAAVWNPGKGLPVNAKKFLSYLGVSREEIQKINFNALKTIGTASISTEGIPTFSLDMLQRHDLPDGAKPFSYWADNPTDEFLEIISYLNDRNPELIKWGDYYWTPDPGKKNFCMNKRIIVPFKNPETNWTFGYAARSITDDVNPKYVAQYTNGYLFGQENLFKQYRKYAIICEGIFDAISIDGVATMKQTFSDFQLTTIRTSNKKIIVLPDRDQSGEELAEQAIEEGFSISMPDWGKRIKDAADAVKTYGRGATIATIINYAEDNPLKNKIRMKTWFK